MKVSQLTLSLGLFLGLALTAKPVRAAYSDSELRSLETSDESKIRDLRNQEITQLRITLGRRQPANRMADLYFRLAEIDLEAYHSEYILEGRLFEKRLQAGGKDHSIDHSHSRPYLSAGIKACQELLAFKIPYPRIDQVYYFMGFNYGELGNRKESLKYYDYLTRNYPRSNFVGEAYRELGDASYGAQEYKQAEGYYELALKKSNPDTEPRVLHKLAWCYYHTKQFDRAVDTMKQAVAKASASSEKFLNLREEALRDMAIFMTETGRVDEALDYFSSVSGDKTFYPKLLEKLGHEYERSVQPAKATQVYESLLKTHPTSEAAYRVLARLVELDLHQGKFHEAISRLQGNAGLKSGEKPTEPETQTAIQNLKAMVRRTATEHHEAYRKKGSHVDLEVADSFYATYLSLFLSKEDPRGEIPEIEMYLAEVDRDLGRSKEASELYRKVIDSKDKRYAKEAGALWTASLAEAIKKSGPNKTANPSPIEEEYVEAADRLEENLPDTSEAREASLRAAQVLAGYKSKHAEAVKRAQKLALTSPKTAQGLTAARLWVQIVSDHSKAEKDEYTIEELHDLMKQLRENTVLMSADREIGQGKLMAMIADEDSRVKVGMISKEEKGHDYAAAAHGYEDYAQDPKTGKDRETAEKAYASAIANYVRADDGESVSRVSHEWLHRFPKSPKAIESLRSAATHALIAGSFDLSTQLFELLGRQAGDPDSLETAALFYEASGKSAEAQKTWVSFLEIYTTSTLRWKVALELARSQEALHEDSEANKAYRYCMAGPSEYRAECGARLADLYFRAKDDEHGKELFKRLAGNVEAPHAKGKKKRAEPLQATGPFVGYARFRLAEIMEESAHFSPLKMPEAVLKKGLAERLAFLEPLSRAYASAQEAGGPWGVAALDRLAKFAVGFANEVDNITPPAASVDAIARFKKSLTAISGPLRAKAVSTWLEGYNKAVSAEVLSPDLPFMLDRLADVKAAKPFRAQGSRGKFRLAGLSASAGADSMQKTRDKLLKNPSDAWAWSDYGNLLWGAGKPLFSKVAYDRALSLNPKNSAALNNRAVIVLSGDGEDDWYLAAEGQDLLKRALREDNFLVPAKVNLASLYGYYRIFPKAKSLWEQAATKNSSVEVEDGRAIAYQALGQSDEAASSFAKADSLGGASSRFAKVFHAAARLAQNLKGADPAQDDAGELAADASPDTDTDEKSGTACLKKLSELSETELAGFEKTAFTNLKRTCSQWKDAP